MSKVIEEKKDCYGCGACAAVCPVKAIHKEEEERGTIYYKLGKGCIYCGKCKKVCPVKKDLYHTEQSVFFKAMTRNKEVLRRSTSGGVAYELALMVIRDGGVVYGAGWSAYEQQVLHMRIDSEEELVKLQGSKYVQSRFDEYIFKVIYEDLKFRKVLVIGTPCQIAAIRSFTENNENLLCVDLICHGVPSSRLLDDQLKLIVDGRIEDISFRKGLDYTLEIKSENRKYSIAGLDNPYYSLFLQFISLRESCYRCKYACRKRLGEVTLGDYVENNEGFSCVISNTNKGCELLEGVRDVIKFEERNSELLLKNHAINSPTDRYPKTDKFTKLYHKHGLLYAYYVCCPVFVFKRKIKKIIGVNTYEFIKVFIKGLRSDSRYE